MVRVGTASWTDKSLIDSGRFYPPSVKTPEDRLRFYASQFSLVEVDSSYYALPAPSVSQLWAERTPASFVFNVKAFRLFTGHQTPLAAFPKDIRDALGTVAKKNLYYHDFAPELRNELWQRFRAALAPLQAVGKLGAVQFQFAPWLTARARSFDHLQSCRRALPDVLLAVEFRNQSWFTADQYGATLDFERRQRFANVVVDEPQGFSNSIPAVWEVTNPALCVVRLHGRNARTWNAKGLPTASDRFNYDYQPAELSEFANHIRAMSSQAKEVHVVFNNNYEDQGQRNARALMSLLD